MSIDVLVFVPDKGPALQEVARVLRQGAWFAITTWEQDGRSDRLGVEQLADYRPNLQRAGFVVEVYDEVANWKAQQRALLEGIIGAQSDLTDEIGADGAASWARYAQGALDELPLRRYVYALVRRL
jgi:SAM-dependent methyltransferase